MREDVAGGWRVGFLKFFIMGKRKIANTSIKNFKKKRKRVKKLTREFIS